MIKVPPIPAPLPEKFDALKKWSEALTETAQSMGIPAGYLKAGMSPNPLAAAMQQAQENLMKKKVTNKKEVAPPPTPTTAVGTVKWFSGERGYGYVHGGGNKPDVFFHRSVIVSESDDQALTTNEQVEYSWIPTDRGPRATTIRSLDEYIRP